MQQRCRAGRRHRQALVRVAVASKRAVLAALIERIEVSVDQIDIRLRPASARLSALLDPAATPSEA